jgi:hypothetical protein
MRLLKRDFEAGEPRSALSEEARSNPIDERLNREEDDELRRLHFMSQFGALSERSKTRFQDLRLRDRRREVRPPREFDNTN